MALVGVGSFLLENDPDDLKCGDLDLDRAFIEVIGVEFFSLDDDLEYVGGGEGDCDFSSLGISEYEWKYEASYFFFLQ